jgi:hypothetical protein
MRFPTRYLPISLTKNDRKTQRNLLIKSRKLYKKGIYYNRPKLSSYKNKKSTHIQDAIRMYKIKTITPNKELSKKTGCSLSALKQIVKKGKGAFYSSGSRPNQTASSWGLARLASSVTGSKSSSVDFHILEKGCQHNKKAYLLAKRSRKKYNLEEEKLEKFYNNIFNK